MVHCRPPTFISLRPVEILAVAEPTRTLADAVDEDALLAEVVDVIRSAIETQGVNSHWRAQGVRLRPGFALDAARNAAGGLLGVLQRLALLVGVALAAACAAPETSEPDADQVDVGDSDAGLCDVVCPVPDDQPRTCDARGECACPADDAGVRDRCVL